MPTCSTASEKPVGRADDLLATSYPEAFAELEADDPDTIDVFGSCRQIS
jgi:hypothetical protein